MKFIALLLFFPIVGFAQTKLEKTSFLNNKVEMLVPAELTKMTDEIWKVKYQKRARTAIALSDENGRINLLGDMTAQPASESQIASFKDFQLAQLKKNRRDMEVLSDGVKTVNGKKVGYFKFLSQAIDQKVFNYYFFTLVNGKILFFTFNCIEKLQKDWEKTADEMVASLKTK